MDDTETYLLVFYAWLATAPISIAACDLVIDDGLAHLPHYVRMLERRIKAGAGITLDLSGLEVRAPRFALADDVRRKVECEALAMFPRAALTAPSPAPRGWTQPLCPRKLELVSAIL
jgi:hypothetical protein